MCILLISVSEYSFIFLGITQLWGLVHECPMTRGNNMFTLTQGAFDFVSVPSSRWACLTDGTTQSLHLNSWLGDQNSQTQIRLKEISSKHRPRLSHEILNNPKLFTTDDFKRLFFQAFLKKLFLDIISSAFPLLRSLCLPLPFPHLSVFCFSMLDETLPHWLQTSTPSVLLRNLFTYWTWLSLASAFCPNLTWCVLLIPECTELVIGSLGC